MNKHLLLFTIGPVQSFIAQARKTQDLYAGSRMLSRLIEIGMKEFHEQFPNEKIIFPTVVEQGSLPNRFIGEFVSDNVLIKEKAENVQNAIKKEWYEIALRALSKANISSQPAGFKEQIRDHLNIYWVSTEISGSYADAYLELEKLSGAIKNVRQFEQYTYNSTPGETGRKCSIDGINNALFRKDTPQTTTALKKATPVKGFLLNPGEGLSAVSLTKRYYYNSNTFPSTAEVALMHDEQQLSQTNKLLLKCFKDLFSKNFNPDNHRNVLSSEGINLLKTTNSKDKRYWNDQFDYQLLFEENLNNKTIPNHDQLKLSRLLNSQLRPYLKTKYYAIILFDGDRMGKWLSGSNNKDKENLESFHRSLSKVLSEFGKECQKYLRREKLNGQTVYAGGDDFLGFVNIHNLFETLQYLREKFHQKINSVIYPQYTDRFLTFSAGIVIAHYKTPFSEVLKKVREIEKKAKKEGDRNAFGISVIKHSGEIQEAVFKWDTDKSSPSECANWKALAHIASELDKEKGAFSNTFIQNLTVEISQLIGIELNDINPFSSSGKLFEEAITTEMKRLITRSLKYGSEKERIQGMYDAVRLLWKNAPYPNRNRNFLHALQIADFLTRKIGQDK